jgi:predicted transcriptional regulator
MPTEKEVVVYGENALEVVDALNSTTLKILKAAKHEPIDVTTLSKNLKLSEAYISEMVRALEDLKLISVTYERGKRGIRKISTSSLEKITIILTNEELLSSELKEKH